MPPKKFHEKDRVEIAIDRFAALENPTEADLNRVSTLAQVEEILEIYRAEGQTMTLDELEAELHDSQRLSKHMAAEGEPRPHGLCDAHAIISGAHPKAARLRAVLAWFKRRIDDPVNGCWLPRNTEAVSQMPEKLRRAVPHSRIHRATYYRWLRTIINMNVIGSDSQLIEVLRQVKARLQAGTIPPNIIPTWTA